MPSIPRKQKPRPWIKPRKPFDTVSDEVKDRPYNSKRWRKASHSFLVRNPLCVYCLQQGRTTAAQVTDHIDHDRFDFWDKRGWQALCRPCHDRKSGQDGNYKRKEKDEGMGGINL